MRTALPDDAIVWDDARVRAYRIPPRDATGVVADCVSGWYPVDRREDSGQRFRWTNGDALLSLSLLDREPRTVHLAGVMFSYRRATTVDVVFNGQPLTTLTVGPASQAVAFDLPLAHGYNALQFRSREAPLQPSQAEGLADNRALSIALADVQISGP